MGSDLIFIFTTTIFTISCISYTLHAVERTLTSKVDLAFWWKIAVFIGSRDNIWDPKTRAERGDYYYSRGLVGLFGGRSVGA